MTKKGLFLAPIAAMLLLMSQVAVIVGADAPSTATAPTDPKAILKQTAKEGSLEMTLECPATMFSGRENVMKVTIKNNGEEPVH